MDFSRSRFPWATMATSLSNKPRRARPEFDTVVVPIRNEMENAGFRVRFLGKKHRVRGLWVSSVPTGIPDIYAYHPERKLSVWIEAKAPGKPLRPEQRAFLADHAGSETQAVCWDSVAECIDWLTREGLRAQPIRQRPHYPYGIHAKPNDSPDPEAQVWSS